MKLKYIYHSGFALEDESFIIVTDYYRDITADKKEGLLYGYLANTDKRLYFLSSHSHADHFNRRILTLEKSDTTYVLSSDIEPYVSSEGKKIVFLSKGDVYEDENLKIKAYGSTDIGVSFYIEAGGKRIFHSGDLNNWHWRGELPATESKQCEDYFLREISEIAAEVPELDLAMFPVDPRLGKDYMLGAQQFVDKIKTKQFAPMHFGEEYKKASAFSEYAEARGIRFIRWEKRGDEMEV